MKEYSTVRRRPRVRTVNDEPSLTVQSDAVRGDIRHILAKYKATGVVDHMRNVDLQFRDVSEFTDFSDMMRQTQDAKLAFMKLPSKVREIFEHDVFKWLDAAHDPEKLEALKPEFVRLGLMKDDQAAAAVSAPAAVPPAGTPTA